ncbi:MAG: sugar ABC transporter ATP-binding protein [Alphaproteobacteria bacterium]
MAELRLSARDIAKTFPPNVAALQGVSLDVRPGEVHCLLGANGAGKSTLLKIIAGAHQPDSGRIEIDGLPRRFHTPREAAAAGISIIYQELDLIAQMTVAENLFLGRAPARLGIVRREERRQRARRALDRVGARFSPDVRVQSLSLANQQLAAIARSLTMDARLIIMDEPSAALNDHELKAVFTVIREIVADGRSVLYVSHRLKEILEIGDRVTVLRGGRTVGVYDVADVTEDMLVEAVVGGELALVERHAGEGRAIGEVALDIRSLDGPRGLAVRDLQVRRGEIVGLAGLNGSGRSRLLRSLFGEGRWSGEIALFGRRYRPRSPADAIRLGVALVPESRKTEGLVLGAPILRNIVLPSLRGRSLVRRGSLSTAASGVLGRLDARYASLGQAVEQLSGGNQQKVVLAKWVMKGCEVLLLDEPSRGLDVGAKADLYVLAGELAARGAAVLVASSETEELYANCDRVWVMHQGRNVAAFDPAHVDRGAIERATIRGAALA